MSKVYKSTIRLATAQYEFIEVVVEGSPEDILEAHNAFKRILGPSEGLPDKEFDAFIQRQLSGETNHVEEYNRMSDVQKHYVQVNKRALKRITASQERDTNVTDYPDYGDSERDR